MLNEEDSLWFSVRNQEHVSINSSWCEEWRAENIAISVKRNDSLLRQRDESYPLGTHWITSFGAISTMINQRKWFQFRAAHALVWGFSVGKPWWQLSFPPFLIPEHKGLESTEMLSILSLQKMEEPESHGDSEKKREQIGWLVTVAHRKITPEKECLPSTEIQRTSLCYWTLEEKENMLVSLGVWGSC